MTSRLSLSCRLALASGGVLVFLILFYNGRGSLRRQTPSRKSGIHVMSMESDTKNTGDYITKSRSESDIRTVESHDRNTDSHIAISQPDEKHIGSDVRNTCEFVADPSFAKPFLYLTQTEKCAPKHLLDHKSLGSPGQCRCEILVLSYKQKCNDVSSPHVTYLFNSSTTWTTGRNLLYRTAMEMKKYMYYIFMDDDIFLEMQEKTSQQNSWRYFENSLIKHQPPMVSLDTPHGKVSHMLKNLNLENCSADFIPATSFDAMVCAFHYKAIQYLLPYNAKYDRLNWWYSQHYLWLRAFFIFYDQVFLHTTVIGINPRHRPYPRAVLDQVVEESIKQDVIQAIRKEFPDKPELLARDMDRFADESRSYCRNPPQSCSSFLSFLTK